MLRRGGLPLFIGPCGMRLIVVCTVRSVIDSRACGENCDYNSYVSVRKYKQRKIAKELHRSKWVSLPLVDAILRDDVLISFITPPELSPDPKLIYDILNKNKRIQIKKFRPKRKHRSEYICKIENKTNPPKE